MCTVYESLCKVCAKLGILRFGKKEVLRLKTALPNPHLVKLV